MPIDPNIPLQAGQSLPKFGPDWGVIQNALKTQIAMQGAQQVQQTENALKIAYSDPNNFDPNTLALKPNAMVTLAQQAPQAAMEVRNNMLKNQEQEGRAGLSRSKILDTYGEQAAEIANRARRAEEAALADGVLPEAAKAAGQKVYTEAVNAWLPNLPPEIARSVPPDYSYQRALTTEQGWKEHQAAQKEKLAQDKEARQVKRDSDMDLRENRRIALAEQKAEAPEFKGDVKREDGTIEKGVPLKAGGPTGFTDSTGKPVQYIPSSVHKIGQKTEENPDDAGKPTGNPELHGAEYLKELPGARSALVKGYAEGRVSFPGSFSLKSPYWQKVIADITQYDPDFDAVNYNARAATRKDFTSGKSAQNITSFNTAIGHLGTLDKAAEELNNTRFPAFNSVANFVASNTGDPRVVKFNTAKQAVADELTRAFRGTGGNVYDIKGWEENLGAANSPAQLRGAVKQAVDLLRSRIESIGQQYRRGMGTTADVMDLLTPSAKKTLARLPGGEDLEGTETTVGGKSVERPAARPENEAAVPPKPAAAAPAAGAPPQGNIPTVKTKAERDALDPDTEYYKEGDDRNAPPRRRGRD